MANHDPQRDFLDPTVLAGLAGLPLETNVQTMTIMATKMPFVGRG